MAFGWPYETTVFMCRMVIAGVFQRHPDLRILMSQAALVDLATGMVSAQDAFSGGRIQVEGDSTLEVYLGHFFCG